MLNTCILIGRIIRVPRLETFNNMTDYYMLIEVQRSYRLGDGSVQKDIFCIRLWRGLAAECNDTCHIGDVVAIKGRMETFVRKDGDRDEYNCCIVAEKLTYIGVDGRISGMTL